MTRPVSYGTFNRIRRLPLLSTKRPSSVFTGSSHPTTNWPSLAAGTRPSNSGTLGRPTQRWPCNSPSDATAWMWSVGVASLHNYIYLYIVTVQFILSLTSYSFITHMHTHTYTHTYIVHRRCILWPLLVLLPEVLLSTSWREHLPNIGYYSNIILSIFTFHLVHILSLYYNIIVLNWHCNFCNHRKLTARWSINIAVYASSKTSRTNRPGLLLAPLKEGWPFTTSTLQIRKSPATLLLLILYTPAIYMCYNKI